MFQKINKFILLLLALACGSSLLSAQSWTIYNTANSGIPDNNIRAIAVDQQHTKWIGTDAGLVKFDGTTWTVYNTANSGLPDNSVRTIFVDDTNTVWVGTFQGGLARFNGSTWQVWNTINSSVPSDFIRGIAFDTSGNLWLATSSGLAFYNWNTWQIWNTGNSILFSDNISGIAIGPTDNKYICTINGGFYDITDTGWVAYSIAQNNLPDNSAVRVVLDANETRWYPSPAAGLMLNYNFNYWTWYNTLNSGIGSNALTDLAIDSLDRKYCATMQRGVVRFTPPGIWTIWDTATSPMPDEYVQCVAKETNAITWAGTRIGGLVRIDENPTSVQETSLQVPSFQIYPNPALAGRIVSLNVPVAADVLFYNSAGQLVASLTTSDGHFHLPAELGAGLYIAEVRSSEYIVRTQLVIY
jgi:ligand-binding sensor domain-containing protein